MIKSDEATKKEVYKIMPRMAFCKLDTIDVKPKLKEEKKTDSNKSYTFFSRKKSYSDEEENMILLNDIEHNKAAVMTSTLR